MTIKCLRLNTDKNKEQGEGKEGGALLTCYLKDNTEGRPHARRRAVVICPGGGYEFCSTREAEPVAMQFLAMDCQAFVLTYSTAPAVFPHALRELALSVAMIRAHAEEWHVDENRVIVCGFSAGGHLAASLGVFWDREFVWEALGLTGERVRPDGLILAYPVISSGEFAHRGSFEHLTGRSGETKGEELWELLSLERQAGPQTPPVFMWHTAADGTVPVENALLFAMALRKAGVSMELHIFPEGRHGLALASEETAKDMDDGRGTYVVPACQQWIRLAGVWLAGQFPENSFKIHGLPVA